MLPRNCCWLVALTALVSLWTSSASARQDASAIVDGTKVHYRTLGKGPRTLVFVHGWTCNMNSWSANLDAFPEYRVIAIDLPGHGASDKPPRDYSLEYLSSSIAAVFKDAAVDRAILIGHSIGARLVHRFHGEHPDKVAGLVMVDGFPWANRRIDSAGLARLIESYRRDYAQAFESTVNMMVEPVKDRHLRQEIRAQMHAVPSYVAISVLESVLLEDRTDLTVDGELTRDAARKHGAVKVPVLAILAKNLDPGGYGWPDDTERFLRGFMKDFELQLWPGASHFLMMEQPGEFNETVRRFARRAFREEPPLYE